MNEISNFCNGECTDGGYIPPSSTTCGCSDTSTLGSYKAIEELYLSRGMEYTHSQRSTAYYDDSFDPENPPYAINNDNDHDPLNAKTVDMNAHHYLNILEYDAHNLFGLTEAIATSTALENYYGHRSFVLTRSSFVRYCPRGRKRTREGKGGLQAVQRERVRKGVRGEKEEQNRAFTSVIETFSDSLRQSPSARGK